MTTADSATITAQDRSQGRLEPVHAMNDVSMNGEEPGRPARALPGRPPGIRADSSGLTDRQRRVIEVIRDSVQRRGYPPSMREIGQAVGLSSTSSVAHQLMALERKGFLEHDTHRVDDDELFVLKVVGDEVIGERTAASGTMVVRTPRSPVAAPVDDIRLRSAVYQKPGSEDSYQS